MIRAALVSILLLLLSACSRTEQVETLTGFAQGTTWHVTVWQPGGVESVSSKLEQPYRPHTEWSWYCVVP